MGIKELRTQTSMRRKLQHWRSMRWLSRADINLDDSLTQGLLAGGGCRCGQRLWQRARQSPKAAVALLLLLPVLALVGVLLSDAVRLLPCMRPGAMCFNLALAEFKDICDFDALPVRLTTTALLPPLYSRLHVKSTAIEVGVRNSGLPPVGSCFFDESNAVTPMVLTGGHQNITVDTTMFVRNGTGMGMIFSLLLNEVDFQVVINTKIKVVVETPLKLRIPVSMQSDFFLTCAHLPCTAPACKYICQFGDYPLTDPDPSTPYPYVTRVEKVRLGYDEAGVYTISPEVHVWLTSFKAATVFPRSIVDLYYYNHTRPGHASGFRERADLSEDHKLFQVTMHDFVLQSLEASGGRPFLMKMDLRAYNDTPGQAATARDFTTRFLRKDPLYVYLAATPVDKTCPKLRSALLRVPPAGLSLNTNSSTKDGSDSSLAAIGALTDVFRVNSVDLFSLNNTILRSFVNVTLMLPFALEGSLPALDMDGFAGPDLMGHFRAFPITLPPVVRTEEDLHRPPLHSFGKEKMGLVAGAGAGPSKAPALLAPPMGEATLVMFTEAELSPWGAERVQTIFPDVLARLEELDIDLVGAAAPEGNVIQQFLSGVVIKLASLEDGLVRRDDKASSGGGHRGGRLFYTPEDSVIKPRVHLEVKSITYEHSHDSGLLAYVNITYVDAFQGRFDIRGGSMHFLLADENSTALATVTVLDSILSRELTHLEAEIFIADYVQAEAVHNVIASYTKDLPTGLKVLDGVVDTAMALKQQVPIDDDSLQRHCASDIDSFCPGLEPAKTRACLNEEFGSRVLSHECLKVILPRGALDVQIPNLERFVDVGRGIASDVMEQMQTSASKVAVNLVEVLSLRTPEAPMDLQLILGEDKARAPDGTQVEVRARTNLSIGLLDMVDLTYTVPPVAIGIAAPLSAADAATNTTTSLFTLAIPAMDKALPRGPLLVESTVRIGNIYHATAWLEDLMADLQDKYVVAQPLNTGDVWSYMVEPLRLHINVLAAINSTTPSLSLDKAGAVRAPRAEEEAPAPPPAMLLQTSNETWSKILFRAASYPDVIVTETQLAFSRPWTEAIDVRIPPMKMSVFTSFVEADGSRVSAEGGGGAVSPILTDASRCAVDPRKCHLGHFKAGTFRTEKGAQVMVDTNLNMTASDDGRFWATLLSDYVAGARVGLWLKTETPAASSMASSAAAAPEGESVFEMDASIILPKMPPLNTPLNDLVNEVNNQLTRRALASSAHAHGHRGLSLAEIWASLDPIILAATQPVSVKVDTIRLHNLDSPPIDPMNASSISLGADLVARSVVTIPDILELDLRIPPLSMSIFSGSLADLAGEEQRLGLGSDAAALAPLAPWAAARVSEFVYHSKHDNASETALHVDLLNVKRALDVAKTVLSGQQNLTITVAGAPQAGMEAALFSRIFSHMRVQLDLSSRPTGAEEKEGGGEEEEEEEAKQAPVRGPEERLFVTARLSSTAKALAVDADVYVPRAMNPMMMTVLAGAMDLTLSLAGVATPMARIAVDPVALSQETDSNLGVRVELLESGLQTVLELLARLRAQQPAELVLEGTMAAWKDLPSGRFYTSLQVTPALLAKWGIFGDGEHFLRLSLDELLSDPTSPLRLDNVGLVGGDEIGSDVTLPCLLKGWCDGGLAGAGVGTQGGSTRLKAVVAATVTRLSEFLGLNAGCLGMSLSLPELAFRLGVDPVSASLGRVTLDAATLNVRDGTSVSLLAGAELWDLRGLQATVFRLWEAPFTAVLTGDAEGRQDVLTRLLAALPIAVEVPGPTSPAEAVPSLRTLPTLCDGRWTIEQTTATGFTARVDLPPVTAPVSLTLDHFAATVLYKDTPVLEASTRDGTFHLGPKGGTRALLVETVAPPPADGGSDPAKCPYKTTTPALCLLGEVLGKIMTFGDSGAFRGEMVLSFQNPWLRDRIQTVRMPIQLYGEPGPGAFVGAGAGSLPQLWGGGVFGDYTPPVPKSFTDGGGSGGLQCAAASEMVRELYINLEDTVGASLQFWKTVEVALKVFMVNIFAFPLDIAHLRLTMFFRDPDGVPEARPSLLVYLPSYDYCLLYDVELPTPGLSIAPGKGQWTPLLHPRMDETRLVESLARLFDEAIVHKRLCADMLDSVIGVSIRGPPERAGQDAPFVIDLPVSIRSIPFYSADACATADLMKAGVRDDDDDDEEEEWEAAAAPAAEPPPAVVAPTEVEVEATGPVLPAAGADGRRLRSYPNNKQQP